MPQTDGYDILMPKNFIVPHVSHYARGVENIISGSLCISGAKLMVNISGWREITTA